MATNEVTPAEYRYYTVDLLTNNVIAEIPFTGVSYSRALSKAGSFSGDIPMIDATSSFNLYETTMPGKTALYVLRNGVCVWGGIIWSRSYSPANKTLTIDGQEFISYLYHRAVWQTLYYGSEGVYCSKYQAGSGTATVLTDVDHGFAIGDRVRVASLNPAINGDHVITATPSLASFSFASAATLALSPSTTGLARTIVDSYEVVRDILGWLSDDFGDNQFINDEIKPASEIEYSVVNKVMTNGLATLTTSLPHDLIEGQLLQIIDVDAAIDGYRIITSIPTSTSFTFQVEGSSANVASAATSGLSTYNVTSKSIVNNLYYVTNKLALNNIVTITTNAAHNLVPGDEVSLSNVDTNLNGTYTVATTPTANTFTYVKTVANIASTAFPPVSISVTNKILTNNVATLTANNHGYPPGQTVTVVGVDAVFDGSYAITAATTNTFSYSKTAANVSSAATSGTASIVGATASYKTAVLVTSTNHGLSATKTIVVDIDDAAYDGVKTVSSTVNATTLKFTLFSTLTAAAESVYGGTLKWGSRAVAGTYGSYSSNSSIGIDTTVDLSGKYLGATQQVFRGSELKYFGEILEDFAKNIDGFEYRIDCDFSNDEFTRTFRFVPFIPPPQKINVVNKQLTSNIATLTTEGAHGLEPNEEVVIADVGLNFNGTYVVISAPTSNTFTYQSYGNNVPSTACLGSIGSVHPLSVLGADQYVFEYPGNILDFKVDENAEDSATRMWVSGNNEGLDGEASQPYAAATSTDMLANGWPVLDLIDEKNDVQTTIAGESALYDYAKEFLDEARPPEATFTIDVNGSINPVVGDYLPGDWCSIIIDDEFVRLRLGSDLEPRGDIIVRKIVGYKVSVPETPTFPEKVTLELISEWKEDRKNA